MQDNIQRKGILIVDDDRNNIDILQTDLEDEGYDIFTAEDGVQGWQTLQENKDKIGCILLDRMMPNMSGMEFMVKLKADESVSQKPVIMQTAAAEKSQVAEGIKAGVYYYLTKPYELEVMLSVVRAAINDYADLSKLISDIKTYKQKIHIVKESFFEIGKVEDIRYLVTFLANYYPDPQRVVLGLSELLTNAVEHGNLGISYEDKTRYLNDNIFHQELERRQQSPEHSNKKVLVHFKRGDDHIYLNIKDEGNGFDWQNYMTISPDRATHNHGRGIALSNMMSFDSIEYRGVGNEVVCMVSTK